MAKLRKNRYTDEQIQVNQPKTNFPDFCKARSKSVYSLCKPKIHGQKCIFLPVFAVFFMLLWLECKSPTKQKISRHQTLFRLMKFLHFQKIMIAERFYAAQATTFLLCLLYSKIGGAE